jgi:hypothetical protein
MLGEHTWTCRRRARLRHDVARAVCASCAPIERRLGGIVGPGLSAVAACHRARAPGGPLALAGNGRRCNVSRVLSQSHKFIR